MSLACRDLLGQLLTPEPDARITLSRIMRHPWFVRDAPPGLLELNSRLLRQDRSRHALALNLNPNPDPNPNLNPRLLRQDRSRRAAVP